ncbi:C6 transcription factor domain-containing protein [Talaromyces proteolyticus]|uniref:C6 transcription factor domain-containing protein n=1 Tax=Talaromyces proteolyticus TaxID=1131652 RepID=A0AAD4KG29_9EURO|nr:C6 transcription factor domain-containing protein [Talaromyces proteolyticus]KAH8690216.1 C6 transcription factor domain-containing protein [Talaromyces proteolyticus]
MAPADVLARSTPVAIAPAPGSTVLGGNGVSSQTTMLYACNSCAKRKVKCNKETPICSSCRRGKLSCCYQAPQSVPRKRKLSDGVLEKLAQYERILRQHDLLDADTVIFAGEKAPHEPATFHPQLTRKGKLLASHGKSRYMDSNILHSLGYDGVQAMSDDDQEEDQILVDGVTPDPLTGALINTHQSLVQYHPTHTTAMVLFQTHIENVEPLCKILHIPSAAKLIQVASQQPTLVSKSDECLMFAIYHFAVFSMTEEDCGQRLGQSRAILMQRYRFAAQQALVNASFLKTTEMPVLQALVLFLIPCQYHYDSQTFWVLTGVAVRIAQRMGLHRDGEKLGLPPFDVQMRRRLFYQLLPLEGTACQLSGAEMPTIPVTWDVQSPLNLNDDHIWPGMAEMPEEQKGATEMIFCLLRLRIGTYLSRLGGPSNDTNSWQFKDLHEAELAIDETESEIEKKFIRYCDIVNPLHFLAIGSARSGITAMRLRIGLSKIRNETATNAERRELFQHAQKILDSDTAIYTHPGLQKYRWFVRSFFLWGTWDSLIFVLTSFCKNYDTLLETEKESAWKKVEQIYQSHYEIIDSKRVLHVALRCLTLKAWDIHGSHSLAVEPTFIATLQPSNETGHENEPTQLRYIFNFAEQLVDLNPDIDFDFDPANWLVWDQLIQDHQVQDGQQPG